MADIDFGTGPNTGDTLRVALEKLQSRVAILELGGGGLPLEPQFIQVPSINPSSGQVGTVFTGTDGVMDAGGVVLSRRWLLSGTAIGSGITVTPVVAGDLVLENTGTGGVISVSNPVAVSAAAPVLSALSVSPVTGTVGVSFNATITGKTVGSTLTLTGAGSAGLSVSNSTITGTPTTAGGINIIETLTGATNSPRTSAGTVAIAAAPAGPLAISGSPAPAVVGNNDTFTPTISGGTSPYTLSLASGTLPPGRTVNGSARTVSGTYTTAGTYNYVLRVTDANSATATLSISTVVTAAVQMIAWTPAMISALEVYDASVASSALNASGTQAQPGEGVATWQSQTANSRTAAQATTAAQPIMGTSADASPTGVIPLTFRGSQVLPTNVNPSKMDRYTIFAVMRLKAGITGSKYLIGNDDGGVYNLLQSSAAAAGSLRPLIASQTFETDTTERVRSFTQNMQISGLSFSRIQGREDSLNTTGSGGSLAAGKRFFLGSNSSNGAGGLVDFFAFALVDATVSRANQQRMEGYLAHRAGLASSALDPSHPYYSAPPMVPAGTTTTLDWIEFPAVTGPMQTFMGGYIELQPDSFNSYSGAGAPAPTDGTTDIWGFPYSLTTSERARFKAALFGPNPRLRYIRFPLGFAYRGLRNIDGTSGLAKNIGERFAGQNAAVADMLSNVIPLGGGLMPEYWSPPPHWKTTSSFAKGRLWAGGTYARDVSLASIQSSDTSQFAAQVDALTTAMVNDLEYLHQNVGPVRGFGLQNEGISGVDQNYGTCQYTEAEYGAVLRSVIPKIRNSSILSTYGGQANTVLLNGESYKGFGNAGTTFSNSTVLSTGKTTLQEMWAQTYHEITNITANPDYIRNLQWDWIAGGRGKPTFVNEIEFFNPTAYTDAERFSRACAWQLHNFNLIGAPVVMPFIHAMKDIDAVNRDGNQLGYALTKMRLPQPYGAAPGSTGDNDPTIDYGTFDFVKQNWHAALFTLDNIPVGSVMRKVDLPTGVSGIAAAATTIGGKRRILVANWSANPLNLRTTLGAASTFNVQTYTATDAAVSAGTVSGPSLSMTFQPYTAYVLTEA